MRKRLLIVAGACLTAVAGAWLWAIYFSPRVTLANYDRVQPGMSRADVEAILGRPLSWNDHVEPRQTPGDDPRDKTWAPKGTIEFEPGRLGLWVGSDLDALVGFDAGGAVCWKKPHAHPHRPRGDLDRRVRVWFYRLWPW